MLTSRITNPLPPPDGQDFIDIFSSSFPPLFTDDAKNFHGTPGSYITYTSPRFGDLTLHIPVHPDIEEGRKLFAHHLWNSGVVIAEGIEQGSQEDDAEGWHRKYWDVRGKKVLELGAGTALPSIVSALSAASIVTITDHPSSPSLSLTTPSTVALNVKHTVFPPNKPARTTANISIRGYVWGEKSMYSTKKYGAPIAGSAAERYDRILIADCLWMPSEHEHLIQTICHFLDDNVKGSCALVVAGFHTGRAVVGSFFELATKNPGESTATTNGEARNHVSMGGVEAIGGRLEAIEMFEIDVDSERREWKPCRPAETKDDAKRWCVVAVLVKNET